MDNSLFDLASGMARAQSDMFQAGYKEGRRRGHIEGLEAAKHIINGEMPEECPDCHGLRNPMEKKCFDCGLESLPRPMGGRKEDA